MKRIVSVLSVLCFALVLSACGSGAGESADADSKEAETQITIWTFFDRNMPGYYYLFEWDELEEKYGVDIEVTNYSSDEMENKLLLALASGELPDAFYTEGGTYIGDFIDAGVCAQTDTYLRDLNLSEVYETEYDDGKSYVIPCMPREYVLCYYDDSLFEEMGLEIPETWSDLKKLIESVGEYNNENGTDISAIALGEKDGYQGNLLLDILVSNEDPNLFDRLFSKSPDVKTGEFKKAVKKVVKLSKLGAFSKNYLETGDSEAITNFIHHQSLILVNSSDIMSHLIYNMADDFSVGLFPGSIDENGQYTMLGMNYGISNGFCINSSSKDLTLIGNILTDYVRTINDENVRSGYESILADCDVKSESFVESKLMFSRLVSGAKTHATAGSSVIDRSKKSSWRSLIKALYGQTISIPDFLEQCDELFVGEGNSSDDQKLK